MSNSQRFSKTLFRADGGDCELWPSIDIDLLPEKYREATLLRVHAIKAFLNEGASLVEVEDKYKVNRSTLYRMIERCETLGEDGRVLGFKGVIPYLRISGEKYHRSKSVETEAGVSEAGDAGAFHKLLSEQDELKKWVDKRASQYKPRKEGGGASGGYP
ncbi:hypothetical protein D3C78_678700 [compost metagenome]